MLQYDGLFCSTGFSHRDRWARQIMRCRESGVTHMKSFSQQFSTESDTAIRGSQPEASDIKARLAAVQLHSTSRLAWLSMGDSAWSIKPCPLNLVRCRWRAQCKAAVCSHSNALGCWSSQGTEVLVEQEDSLSYYLYQASNGILYITTSLSRKSCCTSILGD